MLRSKIHQATVTQADLDYVGSITIDEELMEMVGLLPGERVLVVSNTSGARLETYTIPGPRRSGAICMNGAAAHLIKQGDEIIIMGFELAEKPVASKQIVLGPHNEFVRWLAAETYDTRLAEMMAPVQFDGRLRWPRFLHPIEKTRPLPLKCRRPIWPRCFQIHFQHWMQPVETVRPLSSRTMAAMPDLLVGIRPAAAILR